MKMGITPVILLLTVTLTTVSCQDILPEAVTSIMKDILTPKGREEAIKVIKDAANKLINTETSQTLNKRAAIIEGRNVVRKEVPPNGNDYVISRNFALQKTAPTKIILQKPNEVILLDRIGLKQGKEIVIPKKVIVQKPREVMAKNVIVKATPNIEMQKINDIMLPRTLLVQKVNDLNNPTQIIVKKPELAPNKFKVINPEVATPNARKIFVQKANEVPLLKSLILNGKPNKVVVQKSNEVPARELKRFRPVEVTPKVLVKPPVIQETVLGASPFLPAASPVSRLAASGAMPQSRGQFLRKIPIPPPTI